MRPRGNDSRHARGLHELAVRHVSEQTHNERLKFLARQGCKPQQAGV